MSDYQRENLENAKASFAPIIRWEIEARKTNPYQFQGETDLFTAGFHAALAALATRDCLPKFANPNSLDG